MRAIVPISARICAPAGSSSASAEVTAVAAVEVVEPGAGETVVVGIREKVGEEGDSVDARYFTVSVLYN